MTDGLKLDGCSRKTLILDPVGGPWDFSDFDKVQTQKNGKSKWGPPSGSPSSLVKDKHPQGYPGAYAAPGGSSIPNPTATRKQMLPGDGGPPFGGCGGVDGSIRAPPPHAIWPSGSNDLQNALRSKHLGPPENTWTSSTSFLSRVYLADKHGRFVPATALLLTRLPGAAQSLPEVGGSDAAASCVAL